MYAKLEIFSVTRGKRLSVKFKRIAISYVVGLFILNTMMLLMHKQFIHFLLVHFLRLFSFFLPVSFVFSNRFSNLRVLFVIISFQIVRAINQNVFISHNSTVAISWWGGIWEVHSTDICILHPREYQLSFTANFPHKNESFPHM